MTTIISHEQKLNLGRRYELFQMDLREFDLGYVRLHQGDEGAIHEVSFGGDVYFPRPITTSGWELNAQGRLPRPRFATANVGGLFTPMIDNNNGLAGAPFQRIVTYEKYLDGQPTADATQHDPIDSYEINRVLAAGRIEGVEAVQWELRTAPDRPNAKTPRIQIIKGPCQRSYRTFDTATGQFVNGSCPYRGTETFDEEDAVTNNEGDECSQTVPGCTIRFGAGNKIPYLGFPSVGDLRR